MARKPYTCKECHAGPDVPAFKVYSASKHGNIFSSMGESWNFGAVPWTVGKDFTAPTCAACHVSLLVNTDGEVVTERTNQMNNRIPWRIFGLIYANHIRFASAMGFGGDYGVFSKGRYDLSKTFMEMSDWLKSRKRMYTEKVQP